MSNQLNNEKFQIINQIMKNFQILYTSILQYSNVTCSLANYWAMDWTKAESNLQLTAQKQPS